VEQVVVQLNLVNASISLERDGSLKTLRLVDVCCSVIVDLLSLKILHGGCMGFLKKVSLLTATLFFLLCAHGNAMQLQENNQMTEYLFLLLRIYWRPFRQGRRNGSRDFRKECPFLLVGKR